MDLSKVDPVKLQDSVVSAVIAYAPGVLGLFLALILTKFVSGWVHGLVLRAAGRARMDTAVGTFLATLARYGILILGVITALGYVGVQTASFAAVIAAGGLAIGLAFQGTLSNFATGVMILTFRPFRVGDYISGGGESGTVVAIDILTTELKTPNAQRIIVPNAAMFGSTITNFTFHDPRRIAIDVGTAYDADIDATRAVLEGVAGKVEGALRDPAPAVFLSGLGASSVDWQLRIWATGATYWDVHQRIVRQIKLSLDEAGIGIPFPQRDVHLDAGIIEALRNKG